MPGVRPHASTAAETQETRVSLGTIAAFFMFGLQLPRRPITYRHALRLLPVWLWETEQRPRLPPLFGAARPAGVDAGIPGLES